MVLEQIEKSDKTQAGIHLAGVVILAGGNSKRMGSPKAMLTLATGETLLNYHVRQAISLNVPVMIADNSRGFEVDKAVVSRTNVPIFHIKDYAQTSFNDQNSYDKQCSYDKHSSIDPSKGNNKGADKETGGALVAIASALQALEALDNNQVIESKSSSWLLVISCDSLISASTLWQHLSRFININDNKQSVICLSDESHLYPLLALYRLNIEIDLRDYIQKGQRRVMRFIEPISLAVPISEQWQYLTNFNTPEDFQKACMVLSNPML